jgi:hypothetical protein
LIAGIARADQLISGVLAGDWFAGCGISSTIQKITVKLVVAHEQTVQGWSCSSEMGELRSVYTTSTNNQHKQQTRIGCLSELVL